MRISTKAWAKYIRKLAAVDQKAADLMTAYIEERGMDDADELIRYAYALATKYGEAAAAAACEMYDATAAAQGASVPPAEPAPTATYGEVAKAVNGTKDISEKLVPQAVSRTVKMAGADTMLQNAERDGAQFAWVPMGDTCAFCITLASRGWQYMSKQALKGGHAEHIHANCDCQYAIRFDGKSGVSGYDPDKYKKMYYGAEGSTPAERIRAIRREHDAEHREEINARKRDLYARERRLKYGKEESFNSDRKEIHARHIDRFIGNNLFVDDDVTVTMHQVRKVNRQITEAKKLLGIEIDCDIPIILTDLGERALATYNPRTNIMLINKKMATASESEIREIQRKFACPNDPRSTAIHELYHWMDANKYRKDVGEIEDAGPKSEYTVYQRERSLKKLAEYGVDLSDSEQVREISIYAFEKNIENDWEEVYTEFRTKMTIEGGASFETDYS